MHVGQLVAFCTAVPEKLYPYIAATDVILLLHLLGDNFKLRVR